MNYVKITAKSPNISLKLFVKETEVCKILKELQALHRNTSLTGEISYKKIGGVYKWVNENCLSVTMRRARIADHKARRLKSVLAELAVIPNFSNNLAA